ncbi:hypothetical protein [Clostridium sp.]|uniref:hypothetical protein n=1 Tax=Clostridium sp. TaxID=1506 RepID=UPI003216564E
MKKKLLISSMILSIVCVFYIFNSAKEKTIENNKGLVTEIVKTYYNNISNKSYDKAFNAFYYENRKTYEDNIANISKYTTYKLKSYSDNPNWIIEVTYDTKSKSYIAKSTGISSLDNETYNFFENVYVKKIKEDFKIYKINTDDKFYYIRGNQVQRSE